MRPTFAGDNPPYMLLADREPVRKFGRRDALRAQLANFYDLIFGQFRASTLFAFGAVVAALSALIYHVGHIVLMRAKREVRRIHASGIVADVQDASAMKAVTFRDWAIVQFIAKAMRGYLLVSNSKLPVSMNVTARAPFPTFIWAVLNNLCPEPFDVRGNGGLWMMARQKWNGLALDVTARCLCPGGYLGGLTATALAQLWGFVRGILRHVNSSFQLLTTPPSDSRRCGGNCFAAPIIAQMGGEI